MNASDPKIVTRLPEHWLIRTDSSENTHRWGSAGAWLVRHTQKSASAPPLTDAEALTDFLCYRISEMEGLAGAPKKDGTSRAAAEWNRYEPICADPLQLAEVMFQLACTLEDEFKEAFRNSVSPP